jgi:hypothetical protein
MYYADFLIIDQNDEVLLRKTGGIALGISLCFLFTVRLNQ